MPELVELKLQLKEIFDKGGINYVKCITMGCNNIVCEKEIWYSQVVH